MAFVETQRSVVAPAECDHLGHMNVSRYFATVGDGSLAMQTLLGLGPKDVREGRKLSFVVVHADSDFKSELVAGDVICLETGILEIGEKSIVFLHRLKRTEDGATAFETHCRCVMLNLTTRRAVAIPADVVEKARNYLIDATIGK